MRVPSDFRLRFKLRTSLIARIAIALLVCAVAPLATRAQQLQQTPTEEFVANLATGRVIIAVVKDAIVIATVENPIEAQTHVPTPVAVTSTRAEIMLGAVDWISPSSQVQLARLDRELPHLRGAAALKPGSLGGAQNGNEATDLEGVGQAVFERFNEVTRNIHGRIDLPAGEPIAQIVVAGFAKDYGPEVWLLTFDVKQDLQREDYFNTHITRPTFAQFWPPEKGQPHTLVEFQYPPEGAPPTLLDMLQKKTPLLEKIATSDAKMSAVSNLLLAGDSKKILPADAVQFMRAALGALAPENARETVCVITEDAGLQWVLQPPAEAKPLKPLTAPPAEKEERPGGAPSLLHPTSN
jgi:hypothetical protein